MGLGLLGQLKEIYGVAAPALLGLFACLQALQRILAYRLEHREAAFLLIAGAARTRAPQQALLKQGQHSVRSTRPAHRLGSLKRPAPHEHSQPRQELLLLLFKEPVAPVDSR